MTDATAVRRRHIAAERAGLVAAAFTLAAVVGLVRNMIIAQQFGIGADLDAYYAAFKLPDLLFTVVAWRGVSHSVHPCAGGISCGRGSERGLATVQAR